MIDSPMRSDAELVADAAAGSEHAYRALFRAYARPVFWIAHGLLHSRADAEDMVQETFTVAWRKLPGFTLAGESALPWLATICRLQCANRLRRLRRERAEELTESLPGTVDLEAQVVDAATVEAILAEVRTLSALDQGIFRLCAAQGYSYEAAAAELGVSHGVVRNRLSRIRRRLRATVEQEST